MRVNKDINNRNRNILLLLLLFWDKRLDWLFNYCNNNTYRDNYSLIHYLLGLVLIDSFDISPPSSDESLWSSDPTLLLLLLTLLLLLWDKFALSGPLVLSLGEVDPDSWVISLGEVETLRSESPNQREYLDYYYFIGIIWEGFQCNYFVL